MNSKEYWQKRGELTQAHLMQKADDFADDMEKAYKAALESIEKDIWTIVNKVDTKKENIK